MYEYRCKIRRVVDGDTVDVDIDLGFGMWIHNERIRLYGVDTPESRTRDLEEKKYGLLAKSFVLKYLPEGSYQTLVTVKDKAGKFGRVLGEVFVETDNGLQSVNQILIDEGHAYEYDGGKKKKFIAEIKEEKAAKKKDLVDKPAEEE